MDLTNITEPFGLLDAETQKALKEHGGPYEKFTVFGWESILFPNWHLTTIYRVKPPPTPQPKPREWWMFHSGGYEDFKVFDCEDYAKRACGGRQIIHVREVTD